MPRTPEDRTTAERVLADTAPGGADRAAAGGDAVLPRGATDREVLRELGPGTRHHRTAVLHLADAEDVLGGFENAADGAFIRGLLDAKVLYGSWCCSRTNFHHPGATAFVSRPPKLPVGAEATRAREAAGR